MTRTGAMAEVTQYTLAALDMDGTLLNSDHTTTPYTRAVIDRAAKAGRIVALCTGRAMSEIWGHLKDNPGVSYVICESGACLYDVRRGHFLHRITLADGVVDAVFDAVRGMDAGVQCFIDNQSWITFWSDEDMARYHVTAFAEAFRTGSKRVADVEALCGHSRGRVGKINLYFAREVDRKAYPERINDLDIALKGSVGIGWEISPPSADKARGLRLLCDHLGIPVDRAMAVGDAANDLDVMGAAGLSVAMGNALDEVRALADAVTDDCDHDGAAKAIEQYML